MLVCIVLSCLFLVALWSPVGKRADLLTVVFVISFNQMCPGPHQNYGRGWRRETGLSPPLKYFIDRSKAVLLLWFFYVFFSVLRLLYLCARLFKCALWSPAGKGLASWLLFVVSNCEFVTFPFPGSGVVLDCIDS